MLLDVQDLSVTFGTPDGAVPAVRNLSFTLDQGETLGIVGESGSGKSQSVLSMMGLLADNAQASGSVRFAGEELLGMPVSDLNRLRGSRIAMVFQDPMTSLNPYLTVGQQMAEVLTRHKGVSRAVARQEVLRMLDAVRIPEGICRIDQYPHEFSGGMRQRVMIAMGLLCRPQLLIADEPTTALDVTVQAQIVELLRDLRTEFNTAIILITHDLGVVAGLCDRLLVMYAGEAVESGSVHEVFGDTRHPYTMGLLDSLPRLSSVGERLLTIPGQPPDPRALPSGCPFHPRCRHRVAICDREIPALTEPQPGHFKRCHLALGSHER